MFFKKLVIVLSFFLLILVGCSKETIINLEEQAKIQSEITFLIDHYFGTSGTIKYSPDTSEYPDSYVIEGDMMILRETVQHMIKESQI
jgi:hypothetical protein